MEEERDRASKLKGLAWVFAAVAVACLFGIGIGPFARAVPWAWEQSLAKSVPDTPEQPCHADPKADALLKRLVSRLYPVMPDDGDFSIEVQVVKDPVVNAFATLGGRIFLNSGFLAQARSAEEAAGVLAHEIEHVHKRHIIQGVATRMLTVGGLSMIFGDASEGEWAQYFLSMSFTRQQEAEADAGGLLRLQHAHIDNKGFRDFFERMAELGAGASFLSDHPSNESRSEMAAEYKNEKIKPVMTVEEWAALKKYCR